MVDDADGGQGEEATTKADAAAGYSQSEHVVGDTLVQLATGGRPPAAFTKTEPVNAAESERKVG